jgi:hypothetical protein
MPYRIAGIDVHKKMLAVVVGDVEVEGTFSSIARRSGRAPPTCARWPTGWSSARSKKSSWNRPRSIGVRSGKRWSCTGGRSAGRARARARSAGRSTSHKRSRIAGPVAERKTFRMRNVW